MGGSRKIPIKVMKLTNSSPKTKLSGHRRPYRAVVVKIQEGKEKNIDIIFPPWKKSKIHAEEISDFNHPLTSVRDPTQTFNSPTNAVIYVLNGG